MIKKDAVLALALILLILLSVALCVYDLNRAPAIGVSVPIFYWGSVSIDGLPAPIGTEVEIYIGDATFPACKTTAEDSGSYGPVAVWGDISRYGEPLSFTIGGVPAQSSEALFGEGSQVDIAIGSGSKTLVFNKGCTPRHLPDSYKGQIDLNTLSPPPEILGVFTFDDDMMKWLFWSPSIGGCDLHIMVGGTVADYTVCSSGDCEWVIPLN